MNQKKIGKTVLPTTKYYPHTTCVARSSLTTYVENKPFETLKNRLRNLYPIFFLQVHKFYNRLTEVAGEGGTNCPPQKFLLSQQFRHLMRCTKHVNKICEDQYICLN